MAEPALKLHENLRRLWPGRRSTWAMREEHGRIVEEEVRAGRMVWEPPPVLRDGDIFY